MREIKFRAWDKEKMIYDISLKNIAENFDGGYSLAKNVGLPSTYEWDNVVFMQYTGLLDKNGKEIYEGDLIECYTKSGELVYTYPYKVVLPTFYREIWSNNEIDLPADLGEKTKVVVVGNIYQNPELLQDNESTSQ